MNKQKKALTLIELIVVVTILAILSTVAFISFSTSSSDARDTVRTEDISKIQTALESYNSKVWEYPIATNPWKISFTGDTIMLAWEQWSFWETTNRIVWKIPKIPLDPLTKTEYTYSITNDKQEYQLATIFEANNKTVFNSFVNKTNAWAGYKAKLRIEWNYNQKILKIKNVRKSYLLAIPSIIHWGSWDLNIKNILDNKQLLFNWYYNLPKEYINTKYDTLSETLLLVNPDKYIVYSWSLNDLKWSNKQIDFAIKLREAYSWTTIANQDPYRKIVKSIWNEEFISQSILQKTVLPEIEVEAIDQWIN